MALVALAGGAAPAGVRAQTSAGILLGAVGSSNLVRDSIALESIAVRPRLAPLVGVRLTRVVSPRYRLAGEVAVSHSDLMAHGDTSTSVTGLTLWAPSVGLETTATSWLAVEARVGALIYDPSDPEATLFAGGAPVKVLLGVSLRGHRGIGGRMTASVHARYDWHRFTTTQLRARGFTGETAVHRIALGVSLQRSFGRAAPPN